MDYNPHLKPWRRSQPNDEAGKGYVETPGSEENIVWQTRAAPPSAYEDALADALIACFEAGIDELQPLVEALNQQGVQAPDGAPWTVASFEIEMARLGS